MNTLELDRTDLEILRMMQGNARISNVELAKALNMAPSGMLERVRKLEQKKVIESYSTQINAEALGQKLLAFVSMRVLDGPDYQKTTALLTALPEVQEVHHIAGDDCYLVKVRTSDSASLMALMRNSFSQIPNLISTRTTIVLQTVKETRQLVIPEL
ncbi:Lrp/AsnC family transcriptional regulator [Pedobacter yulinensis]|uniref:Lrp/AsnC family transcriptional regulator n=1 Tax=Pedobacter yulinensis TaxID=2126353 RepID=A0A2T3HJ12_9SPHI|nr:Lrp/AsnC family transcriptional regulator [Pedobacter yulinensis]PST82422.1 Lrp/AsnC family transcriptional regulator [Pedobacter yulinensis]